MRRMTASRFDTDTASTVQDGTRLLTIDPEWNVDGRILNGGYLHAALAKAAVTAVAPGASVIAVSSMFVTRARPGPAVVDTTVLRQGGSVWSLRADLVQDGQVVISALITVSPQQRPSAAAGQPHTPPMPQVTDAARSIRPPVDALPGPPGVARLVDYAFVPEDSGWLAGTPSASPMIRCWLRWADGYDADQWAALAMVDLAPPVCVALGEFGWAPTLQLHVGVFGAPAPGPLLLQVTGSPYGGAVVAEQGLLWDSTGALIARSQQTALAPARSTGANGQFAAG